MATRTLTQRRIVVTRHHSQRYLARTKARIIARLRTLVERLVRQDLALLPPESRARLHMSLDRMPKEIPTDLVELLRAALAQAGEAA